jgi:hypothetical protein
MNKIIAQDNNYSMIHYLTKDRSFKEVVDYYHNLLLQIVYQKDDDEIKRIVSILNELLIYILKKELNVITPIY